MHAPRSTSLLLAVAGALAAPAAAQDSVAAATGNDAISAYEPGVQRTRYVLDLVPVATSWNNRVLIGPVLKASRSIDPLFRTQLPGSAALSPGHLTAPGGVVLHSGSVPTPRAFSLWSSPGPGVNRPAQSPPNTAPGSLQVASYARQFALAMTDVGSGASTIVGAIVGQDADPRRLYVERIAAVASRLIEDGDDTATVALGAVDPLGNVSIRVDEAFASPTFAVRLTGENAVRIALPSRQNVGVTDINALIRFPGQPNAALDTVATSYLLNAGEVTLNTPAALAQVLAVNPPVGFGHTLALDFERSLVMGSSPSVATLSTTAHLGSPAARLRGNPSFSIAAALAPGSTAAGTAAVLAAPDGARASAINAFGLTLPSPGAAPLVAPGSARLYPMPSPILGPGGFTANAANQAEFHHWLSQVCFRGPSGQVGIGQTAAGDPVFAAAARDNAAGDFIAVCIAGTAPVWTVAARPGQPVLDGISGASVGSLAAGSPAPLSSPAVDLLGNVYFVSRWQPASGPAGVGLFRAVNAAPAGEAPDYRLELLLATGTRVTGANSATPYTVTALALADSDSVASSAFHAGQILQAQIPGRETADPASPFAFGGLAVVAAIAYDRGSSTETYDALLFVSPFRPRLPGDANDDGFVNFDDLTIVLGAFGTTGAPGLPGDLNGDGAVNFLDLALVLGNFGASA